MKKNLILTFKIGNKENTSFRKTKYLFVYLLFFLGSGSAIAQPTPNGMYDVWNWEDLYLAVQAVNAGTHSGISIMQNLGANAASSGNGIATGPGGEDCPHTDSLKKSGDYGYNRTYGGFVGMMPGREGWSCPAITADSLHFEGNNRTISDIYFYGDDYYIVPSLFSLVQNADFRNVTLKTSSRGFRYGQYTTYIGGFVANSTGTILFDNCTFDGNIYAMAAQQAGGFVGKANNKVIIKNSRVTGTVEIGQGNQFGAGGFIGRSTGPLLIENSLSEMAITGGSYLGGMIGTSNNELQILNSESKAVINGMTNWIPGSFVGSRDGYSENYVGGQTGGLIGCIFVNWTIKEFPGSTLIGCRMEGIINSNDTTRKLQSSDYKDHTGGLIGFIGYKPPRPSRSLEESLPQSAPRMASANIVIDSCSVTAPIHAPEARYVGGLIGGIHFTSDLENTIIRRSYAATGITAKEYAGGLIGTVEGTGNALVSESYFRGTISSPKSAGIAGIINQSYPSNDIRLLDIENSYVAGSISGDSVAGFVSQSQADFLIENCFGAVNLVEPGSGYTGKGIIAGNIGKLMDNTDAIIVFRNVIYDGILANGISPFHTNDGNALTDSSSARLTKDMIRKNNWPADWFDSTGPWAIVNGASYPYLKWQVSTDLSEPENSFNFKSVEYHLENSGIWNVIDISSALPADGNYTFRFKSEETGYNAVEAFFPYTTQKIRFSTQGDSTTLNGFTIPYSIVAGGVSISGIIGLSKPGALVKGTVFPFVYDEDDPEFSMLFPLTAALYTVPNGDMDPLDEILSAEPLFTDTAIYYDGSEFIPGTPANPGQIGRTNNPGALINWTAIGKIAGETDTTTLRKGELPSSDIGIYTFDKIPDGNYILVLSRNGFVKRFVKITVNGDTMLEHRELIPGDMNGDLVVDMYDISVINTKASQYGSPLYHPKYDLNADGRINDMDGSLVLFYVGFSIDLYDDTLQWLFGYTQ